MQRGNVAMTISDYQLREARNSDRTVIGRLWRELMAYHRGLDPRFAVAADGEEKYLRHLQEMIRSRDARVLVAEEADSPVVIAYAIGEIQARSPMAVPATYGFVSDIYVSASWRHRGVGSALVQDLKRWFVARKATAMELYIADANPVAAEFWKSLGLTPFLRLMHTDLSSEE